MYIPTNDIDAAVAACVYGRDERKAPDEHRREKFVKGWSEGALGTAVYSEEALERLTWKNLGYRLGKQFGALETARIDGVFEHLSAVWRQARAVD